MCIEIGSEVVCMRSSVKMYVHVLFGTFSMFSESGKLAISQIPLYKFFRRIILMILMAAACVAAEAVQILLVVLRPADFL